MKHHFTYLKDVLRHKQLVFQECRKLGLPLWIAIFHDWSKFRPSEWYPYVDYFHRMKEFPKQTDIPMGALAGLGIRPKTKEDVKEAFLYSCELHYRRNKHHWNHWVRDGEALPMPDIWRREMLADWWAVARALGNESPLAWYTMMKTEGRIVLHCETETWVEVQLGYNTNMIDKLILGYARNHILPYSEWGFWRYPEGVEPHPEQIDDDFVTGKKIYVRHIETEPLVIVTYTNHEPDNEQCVNIVNEAEKWLEEGQS